MPLEKQVTSLKLSQRLKELGVKQESLFWWDNGELPIRSDGKKRIPFVQYSKKGFAEYKNFYSTFTVAELGEMLNKVALQLNCGDTWYQLS